MLLGFGADMRYLTGYVAPALERLTMLVVPARGEATLIVPRLEAGMAGDAPAMRGGHVATIPFGETDDPFALVAKAVRAGARHLKLFPAEAASPKTVKAWKAVLPRDVSVYAVGGVTPANMKEWEDAGCAGFGIGSNIYKPGMSADDVSKAARDFVAAWKNLRGN